jgi:hypothetical protein
MAQQTNDLVFANTERHAVDGGSLAIAAGQGVYFNHTARYACCGTVV